MKSTYGVGYTREGDDNPFERCDGKQSVVKGIALTSLGAFLVHDTVSALTALNGILRLDQVVRATVFSIGTCPTHETERTRQG